MYNVPVLFIIYYLLLQDIKTSFELESRETYEKQLILSVALSAKKEIIKSSYEVKKVSQLELYNNIFL